MPGDSSRQHEVSSGALSGGIGVLGGMGPAATGRFFQLLIELSEGESDQDYPRVVVENNPEIPDRTAHLVGDGPTPEPILRASAAELEACEVDLLTMPCNTAHHFIDELRATVGVPFLDMLSLTVECAGAVVGEGRIGILATDGTIEMGLYQERMATRPGILVLPSATVQEDLVMGAIYGDRGIKAGHRETPRDRLVEAIESLGPVDAVIAGCTEIGLALSATDIGPPLIEPMTIMAREAIRRVRELEY